MKQIAEMLYKIYLTREGEHKIEKPESLDENEMKFVKSLSHEQMGKYLDLESDFYHVVYNHSVALLQYFLKIFVDDFDE